MAHFCEPVNHYQDTILSSSRGRQGSDEVHGHRCPGAVRHLKRPQQAGGFAIARLHDLTGVAVFDIKFNVPGHARPPEIARDLLCSSALPHVCVGAGIVQFVQDVLLQFSILGDDHPERSVSVSLAPKTIW